MLRTILCVFLAAAAGVILFTTIQDDLPDELSILKNTGKYDTSNLKDALGAPLPTKSVSQYQGWGVFADDERVVLATKMTATAPAAEQQLPAEAHFYLECTETGPDLRLILVNGLPYPIQQSSVAVGWGPTSLSNWNLVEGRIIAPQAEYLMGPLQANPLEISIADANGRVEQFFLNTGALADLTSALPSSCRP